MERGPALAHPKYLRPKRNQRGARGEVRAPFLRPDYGAFGGYGVATQGSRDTKRNARSGQLHSAMAPERQMENHMTSFAPGDGAALRSAFGRFGTGVTVVTTQTDGGPIGMTANSFSSVSLEPALVLWSAALRSKRHDAFTKTRHFCIHVLAADQQDVAYHFASQGHDFTRFDWADGPNGAPEISGVLAQFHCDTFAVHPAGDHSLIIGKITHASERSGAGDGLMFDRGRFGTFTAIDAPA